MKNKFWKNGLCLLAMFAGTLSLLSLVPLVYHCCYYLTFFYCFFLILQFQVLFSSSTDILLFYFITSLLALIQANVQHIVIVI